MIWALRCGAGLRRFLNATSLSSQVNLPCHPKRVIPVILNVLFTSALLNVLFPSVISSEAQRSREISTPRDDKEGSFGITKRA